MDGKENTPLRLENVPNAEIQQDSLTNERRFLALLFKGKEHLEQALAEGITHEFFLNYMQAQIFGCMAKYYADHHALLGGDTLEAIMRQKLETVEEVGKWMDEYHSIIRQLVDENDFGFLAKSLRDNHAARHGYTLAKNYLDLFLKGKGDQSELVAEFQQAVAGMLPVGVDGLPPIVDAAGFLREEIPLPAELVEGLLHQGSKMVVGGGSKTFKTWSLIDLAVSDMKIDQLNETEKNLLIAIRNRRDKLVARKIPRQPPVWSYLGEAQWNETTEARKGIVRLDLPKLLGHQPTPSERTLNQRAWVKLKELGLIELHSETIARIRTTHFKITPVGERMAFAVEQWQESKMEIEKKTQAALAELRTHPRQRMKSAKKPATMTTEELFAKLTASIAKNEAAVTALESRNNHKNN